MRFILTASWMLLCFVGTAAAAELPRAKPAAVGLDEAELAKLDRKIQSFIEKKETPGAVVAVARNGKVAYLKSFGEFKQDSLFRIFSMSKPITVAAALMLVDDGMLKLDDPISKYLPAFAGVPVHNREEKPEPITVQHLMQHTAGLTYGYFGNTPIDQQYRRENVMDYGGSLEDMAAKLAKIPLLYKPGERWHYSVATDLLGRVIEVVSKKPFDVFLSERLFVPLGMVDTSFSVPDDKLERFVPNYGAGSRVIEAVQTSKFRKKPRLLSGGGGLISTMADYLRFTLMIAGGGAWNGKRLLEAETVALMTTNQLPKELVPIRFAILPMPGVGFGLGVSVRVKELGKGTREGEWGWGGAASTTFFVSPKDNLVMVSMIQRMPMWTGLDRAIRPLVLGAVKPEPVPVGTK